ncbi:MAG TPA: ABC transporter permease [Terracidiphilus sp.]|jgi:hypothetical protein|nr:ABC transporter permease [Terracidiphilus sp.]
MGLEFGGMEQINRAVPNRRARAGLELFWQDALLGLCQLRQIMTGVLQPGVTVAQANAALAGLSDVEDGTGGFHIVGRPVEKGCCGSKWMSITPGYLSLFKIPVLRGRDFTDSDNARAPAVALINEAFAREFFPHQDPIGQHIDHGQGGGQRGIQTIIGIVADFHDGGLATPANRREISIHLRHAADVVLLDDFGYVVLIIRKHNPGANNRGLTADQSSTALSLPILFASPQFSAL